MANDTTKAPGNGAPVSARLHPDLVPLLERIQPLLDRERVATVQARHAQGRILRLAAGKRKNGMEALARAAGMRLKVARSCVLVAARVSPEELVAFLIAAERAPRSVMGWSTLAVLAAVESSEDRAAWIARTAAEGLTVEGLRRAMAEAGVVRFKGGVREGGGRPYRFPTDPSAVAALVHDKVASFERFVGQAADRLDRDAVGKLRAAVLRLVDDLEARLATGEEAAHV